MSDVKVHPKPGGESKGKLDPYAAMYDLDGSGQLDDLEKLMMSYDVDKSGTFSIAEVKAMVSDLDHQKQTNKSMKKMVFALIALLFCLSGVMLAVVLAGNEASKENHVDGAVMVDLEGEAVQVDNVESFTSLWDLTEVDTETLAYLKTVSCIITKDDASVQASFKVSGAYKEVGTAGTVQINSMEGYKLVLNSTSANATISMDGSVYPVEAGPVTETVARRRLLGNTDELVGSVRLMSRKEFLESSRATRGQTSSRRLLKGSEFGMLSTTGSFALSRGGGGMDGPP